MSAISECYVPEHRKDTCRVCKYAFSFIPARGQRADEFLMVACPSCGFSHDYKAEWPLKYNWHTRRFE